MGSGGFDSPFSPFNRNPINPGLEIAFKSIKAVVDIGEAIEDLYKNMPNPMCSRCGEEIKYGSNKCKCISCEMEEQFNHKNIFENNIQMNYCGNCMRSFIPMNDYEIYCSNCKK